MSIIPYQLATFIVTQRSLVYLKSDRMRQKMPQQAHPQLFHETTRTRKRMDAGRVVLAVIVIGLVILSVFDLTAKRVQSINLQNTEERPVLHSQSSRTIPMLPNFPKPVDGDAVRWHSWATKQPLGTYRFSQSAILHFPYTELDPSYKSLMHEETISLGPNEYPPSVAMKGVAFMFVDPTMCFVLTRKGFKPAMGMDTDTSVNQDRLVVMSFPENKKDFWIGLFDGHGDLGHVTSHSASLEFPSKIAELDSLTSSKTFSKDDAVKHLKAIFLQVDKSLPRNFNAGGSTAISIWKHGSSLYVSNLGDSQAFLASYDKNGKDVKIIYMTKPHKPDLPEERKRINGAGGSVEESPFPGFSARVLVPIDAMNAMALAMSRALGDFEAKKIGVSCVPTTEVVNLKKLSKDRQYFVVAATDGIFDQITLPEVAERVAMSLTVPRPGSLPECLEELIRKSSNKWFTGLGMELYRDDISIAVHRLII